MTPDPTPSTSTAGGNTLYLTFLASWVEEAAAKGSKVARTYRKAHASLSACPIEFSHPCQTTQLAGIGPTIANKLEQELMRWCEEHGQPMPSRPSRTALPSTQPEGKKRAAPGGAGEKVTKKRAYVPQHRSGAYGLLVGLHVATKLGSEEKVRKTQLISVAKEYSDTEYEQGGSSSSRASAAVPLNNQHGMSSAGSRSFYTGWTSIKTLIAKGYVLQSGNPARYCLSEEGATIAATLARDAGVESSTSLPATTEGSVVEVEEDVSEDEEEESIRDRVSDFRPEILKAGEYTIHLVLDNRERHRPGRRAERESIATLLLERGVDAETRALEVGDVVWIARRKVRTGLEADEVVLDHIVERKRLDDLTSSILDGRWRDQKVLYLIEDYDVENQMRKFGPQIQTALSSSQVVDNFFVERTSSLTASIDYLASMDSIIRRIYSSKDLSVIPSAVISRSSFLDTRESLQKRFRGAEILTSFEAFQALNSKSGGLTSQEIFGKMLLCIKGMSAEKVREVLGVYGTVRELCDAFKEEEEMRGKEGLLTSVTEGTDQRKKVGPALSKKVAEVFCQLRYVQD